MRIGGIRVAAIGEALTQGDFKSGYQRMKGMMEKLDDQQPEYFECNLIS